MTVKELIKELQKYDPQKPVVATTVFHRWDRYGTHNSTVSEFVNVVSENIQTGEIILSGGLD